MDFVELQLRCDCHLIGIKRLLGRHGICDLDGDIDSEGEKR